MAKSNHLFEEVQNGVCAFFFVFNVDRFIVRVNFDPRFSCCETCVFAFVPLHRSSCVVARTCPNNVISFACALALIAKFFELVEAFNVAEIVHHAKLAVGHSDFLSLIDKRSAFKSHLHCAKKLAHLVAIETVRANF